MSINRINVLEGLDLAKKNILFVDVREENEVQEIAYDVPNIINIPLSKITNEYTKIPKNQPVVMACRGGARSLKACEMLQQLGYSDLYNLEGGITAWIEEELPIC
ncbi:MAG: rhodanese-like domain-containing protein [Capnocytophaga sp.]|nr:rhodanese-like domain-containing protein [Capnocytophaga sp.]